MLEWRTIPSLPDYAVSENGRVRRIITRKGGRAGELRPAYRRDGRSHVSLALGRCKARTYLIHRLVCELWHGSQPSPAHEVAHNDGNPRNNHYSNLRWATRAENEADKKLHGTDNQGERHPLARLSADDVRQIRKQYVGRVGQSDELARKYGVCKRYIGNIARGKTWGHLDDYAKRRAAALRATRA